MNKLSARAAISKAHKAQKEQTGLLVSPIGKDKSEALSGVVAATADSYINFAHKLGVGADNQLTSSSYGFNPLSRQRTLLEWIHRGTWLGGIAVDCVADDMTRAGINYSTELDPTVSEKMDTVAAELNLWPAIASVVQWGRLYGGAIGVALIDGQDMSTPLREDTVCEGQFRGVLTLDRWQLEPSLSNLVTEFGPNLGLPKFYKVTDNAPALRGVSVHHTRVLFRHVGVSLPYQQQLMENLWGMSILERLYDRLVSFDAATTGAAQLVNKAHLRTLSVKGLRQVVAAQGKPMEGLVSYVDVMRRFQGVEGVTVIDSEDTFAVHNSTFASSVDILVQLGQQISGALQVPLVRLFGQSPTGLNSSGESDLRTYYDGIAHHQQKELFFGACKMYRLLARSVGVQIPDNFSIQFNPLWQPTAEQKATTAKTSTDSVVAAYESNLITQRTALKELRQLSRSTGAFSNVTTEHIAAADDTLMAPDAGELLGGEQNTGGVADGDAQTQTAGPDWKAHAVAAQSAVRAKIQEGAFGGSEAGGGFSQGNFPRRDHPAFAEARKGAAAIRGPDAAVG